MMKVLILGDHATSHVIKWAKSLSDAGLDICIFSLSGLKTSSYETTPSVRIVQLDFEDDIFKSENEKSKWKYLKCLPKLKKLITEFKPDIVHAHYATSYGLLGVLSGFHPLITSVWGSDVYDFPQASFLHRALIKFNLRRSDKILSTSHVMAKETLKYINADIEVTPFGIDLETFKPQKVDSLFEQDDLVIGTIKTLEEKYGISYLIRAFAKVKQQQDEVPLKLLIVGGGTQENMLKKLTVELQISEHVVFTGKVPFEDVPKYDNMLDIYVAVSTIDSESFGVAIIEASACEKPVVVSNVGGLPEVVDEGVTGFVVENKNVDAIANAITRLINDKELRQEMGRKGRERVEEHYDWNVNVAQMIDIYNKVL